MVEEEVHRISLNTATKSAVVEEEAPEEISLSMAMLMMALTRAIAEEEVPKKAVLNATEKVERL